MSPAAYQHSPDRLRAFLSDHGLTGVAAGALLGTDGRTIRRWTAEAGDKGAREMPYSAWYTLHHIVTGEAPQS